MTDDRPSVFHLITRFNDGGAEAVVTDIVTGLADRYAFTVGHGAEYQESRVRALEQSGTATVEFPLIKHYNPVTTIPAALSVARYLRRAEVDLLHTHSTEAGIIGRFAARLAGTTPVVHTVHGVPFTGDRNPVLNRFVQQCERVAADYTDQILVNAEPMAEAYLERGIGRPELYTTVRCGINRTGFESAEPAIDLPGERPRVVVVGRLAAGKGFEVLLDAVERIDAGVFSVAIAGDGPLREQLREEIQHRGLSETVHLLGHRSDIPRVLAASDVFALPSFREGTPRSITEAMAAGLPVVATDVGGVSDQVRDGETGYLIQPGDDAGLADRLRRLLNSSGERARLGAAGRERSALFSRETMLEAVGEIYTDRLHE